MFCVLELCGHIYGKVYRISRNNLVSFRTKILDNFIIVKVFRKITVDFSSQLV